MYMPEKWEQLQRKNMRQLQYNTKLKRHVLESRLPESVVMILRKCCRLSLSDLVSFVDKWEQRTSINVEAKTISSNASNEPITIRVKDQSGEETMLKIKKSTKMSKVFTACAQRNSVNVKSLRFLLDGERINDTDTPEMLELGDGGQIDCVSRIATPMIQQQWQTHR
jgi:small ubiquitin-related modifier